MSNVRYEYQLYEPMRRWLEQKLKDEYRRSAKEVIVVDSHSVNLDAVLREYDVISEYPQTIGLQIEIDVLGIVKLARQSKIVFIEAKKTPLNLHDLGQLWAYCKLCNPSEAFLLSSAGLGSLDKVLKNLHREDMLDFGDGKQIKKMVVARWDVMRNDVDNQSVVPQL